LLTQGVSLCMDSMVWNKSLKSTYEPITWGSSIIFGIGDL
jgi:hypothetical protein